MKQGYLIDMDGVIYRGSEAIPGATEFIRHLATDLGFRSVLTLTGSTRSEDLPPYPFALTQVVGSIGELIPERKLAVA